MKDKLIIYDGGDFGYFNSRAFMAEKNALLKKHIELYYCRDCHGYHTWDTVNQR